MLHFIIYFVLLLVVSFANCALQKYMDKHNVKHDTSAFKLVRNNTVSIKITSLLFVCGYFCHQALKIIFCCVCVCVSVYMTCMEFLLYDVH